MEKGEGLTRDTFCPEAVELFNPFRERGLALRIVMTCHQDIFSGEILLSGIAETGQTGTEDGDWAEIDFVSDGELESGVIIGHTFDQEQVVEGVESRVEGF